MSVLCKYICQFYTLTFRTFIRTKFYLFSNSKVYVLKLNCFAYLNFNWRATDLPYSINLKTNEETYREMKVINYIVDKISTTTR